MTEWFPRVAQADQVEDIGGLAPELQGGFLGRVDIAEDAEVDVTGTRPAEEIAWRIAVSAARSYAAWLTGSVRDE
jgi:hypothetical protein